jgi:hypothetical protein
MKYRNILLSVIVIAGIAAMAMALIPPPPVEQKIGFYDASMTNVTNVTCRGCHVAPSDTHHMMLSEPGRIPYGCLDCHPMTGTFPNQTVYIERECSQCHGGFAFPANPVVNVTGKPHHNSSFAQARDCNHCHGSGIVSNYDDGHYVPAYNTSLVTPYADNKVYNATSNHYWGGCLSCHQNSTNVPAGSPAIISNHDTHHGTVTGASGTYGVQCNWCHVINQSNPSGTSVQRIRALAGQGGPLNGLTIPLNLNTTNPWGRILELRNSSYTAVNGTGCEKCHSVATLHNIQWNYTAVGGTAGEGHINNNADCNGCHAFWDAGATRPAPGPIAPDLTGVSPGKLTAGVATTVTITGSNFVQDTFSTMVSVDGVSLTPISITGTQIKVTVPRTLSVGTHDIQVVKGGVTSKLSTLTVVKPTDIVKAKLASGKITITGTEFGAQPDPAFSDLGVFVTHTATVKRKATTTAFKATVVSWTNTQIVVIAGTAVVGDKLTVKALNGGDTVTIVKK